MLRQVFLAGIAFFIFCPCGRSQQPGIDPAKLAEVQRKMDSLMKDPKLKALMNKNNSAGKTPGIASLPPNIAQLASNPMGAMTASRKPDTAFLSRLRLPRRNDSALATIPAKPLTHAQLVTRIANLKNSLIPELQAHFATEMVNTANVGSTGAANAAALAWMAGRQDVALELAIDGADIDPDDDIALNTLGSVLTLCGMPEEAIPILDYIDRSIPDNATVDNNLGQAYTGLGDIEKGSSYLKRALSQSPYHPNANMTLADIAYIHGDKAAAKTYCENSLRGGFIVEAWTMLRSIDKKASLMQLIKRRYTQPDYFNPEKFKLPEQCKQASDIKKLAPEYEAYHAMLAAEKAKYQKMLKVEQDYIRKNLADEAMKRIHSSQKNPFRPFGEFAITVLGDIEETYGDKLLRLNEYDTVYYKRMDTLHADCLKELAAKDETFKDRADKAGEGNPDIGLEHDQCMAENMVADNYLPQFAKLTEERQREWLNQTKDYFNDYAYWCFLASLDDHQYHQMFYQLVISYLDLMSKLSHTMLIGCTGKFEDAPEISELEFREGKCPINAEIPLLNTLHHGKFDGWIGKINVDCEEFALDLGELLIFSLERKFATGETTIALGAGLGLWIPWVPIETTGKGQFYLTLGGDHPIDGGFRYEIETDIKGLNNNSKAGYAIGINSEGPHMDLKSTGGFQKLSEYLGTHTEQQVNKNVKIYNNNPKGAHKE